MSWMQTYKGHRFYVRHPHLTKYDIEDIAHALSNICRFGGHCRRFYSVAQHSVLVADIVRATPGTTLIDELWALMHDATEAYMIDVPTPIKDELPEYRQMEDAVLEAIQLGMDLPALEGGQLPACVKTADRIALITEAIQLINGDVTQWKAFATTRPFDAELGQWTPKRAAKEFLLRWESIQRRLADQAKKESA